MFGIGALGFAACVVSRWLFGVRAHLVLQRARFRGGAMFSIGAHLDLQRA